MVVFYLRNRLSPNGTIVPITVSLSLDAVENTLFPATGTGFPNLNDLEGEGIWILIAETSDLDSGGNSIAPEIVNVISKDTLHQELESAIGRIGNKIDWGTLQEDDVAPQLLELVPPLNETSDVSILSNIIARVIDPLPATGLDLDTVNMTVNGFPIVTSGIAQPGHDVTLFGNVFDFKMIFRPKRILS